ncbi:MAG: dihydroxy-acid dehydratase [Rickettsiales bacterium]|jgi:dihydroxy-acid dehydratase|nr:dihydroxy-acid dehydratase [Rickettsiales bacterium]
MPEYKSAIFKKKEMSGARALYAATNKGYNPDKPIIAVANSFTEFVPGHTHLNEVGRLICDTIYKAGGIPKEFNTIAIDDGIAMGHSGMLYSLPSREIIADSVEYMVNAHRADALVCISSCDKITPGMVMAMMRLNIPAIIVSGGPMEAGRIEGRKERYDLITNMVASGDEKITEAELEIQTCNSCPTCGSCSGMFTANSMNCLIEALGLALPTNGTLLATHKNRKKLFKDTAKTILKICKKYYEDGDESVLPRNVVTKKNFENALSLDIAMGGSTNTILHTLAIANEAKTKFTMGDIDKISKRVPNLCKVSPSSSYHIEEIHNAGGIMGIMGELMRGGLINKNVKSVYGRKMGSVIDEYDILGKNKHSKLYLSAAAGKKNLKAYSQETYYEKLDTNRKDGAIRSIENAYSMDGGLAMLYGNIAEEGCVVKTAGVDKSILTFKGKAIVCESQEEAVKRILNNEVKKGNVVVIRYEGPKGGPGMQEMLYPTSFIKSKGLGKECALITDGRFSGGTAGLSIGHISPEAAEGGLIALVEDGDLIEIDIPNRKINLNVDVGTLKKRKTTCDYKPKNRSPERQSIPNSLKLYAKHVTNASKGGVREEIE